MTTRSAADVLEDLEFLDSSGVGAAGGVCRTDFATPHSMEKWLRRHERYDLWLSLKRRDPAGTHPSGSDRKKRLMSVREQPSIDPLASLLAQADESTRARTRNRAEKIRALVAELRAALLEESESDAEREEARKEVERLERQLAEARARLRGTTTAKHDSGSDAADLRAWALANDVLVPARGRIPQAVHDAYAASEQATA